jgi:hypothetical protein
MTTGQVPERLAAALADRYAIERELGQGVRLPGDALQYERLTLSLRYA